MKKNRRKKPEFKKPFIILTRRKIAGWLLLIFFLCAWMFVLGVLVGRGTAPVRFDIAELEKKLQASKKDELRKQEKMLVQKDSATVKDKTKLDFYEALKENREDTKVPALQKPDADRQKIEKPAAEAATQTPEKTAAQQQTPEKSAPAKTVKTKKSTKDTSTSIAKTGAAGPVYTIQAASVKDPKDADQLVDKLKKRGYPAYRTIGKVQGKGIWFRVRIGEFKSKTEALSMLNKLKKEGLKPILILREM